MVRNLEWTRGCHIFMRSLRKILATRPGARVLIAGETQLGDSLDLSRVHFLGSIPHHDYLRLLKSLVSQRRHDGIGHSVGVAPFAQDRKIY